MHGTDAGLDGQHESVHDSVQGLCSVESFRHKAASSCCA
jgi:hypothetical protein